MRRICVFCGSADGRDPVHREAARAFGDLLARRGLGLVYGGGGAGLMGAVADAALGAGGEVVGVIPHGLERREVGHRGLSEMRVVGSMHERKAVMASLSDAFVALPGGMGTLEELAEAATWSQLGIHAKPVGLLDVGGYWAPLTAFFDHAAELGFIRPEHRAIVVVEQDPVTLLDRLATWRPPSVERWMGPDET